MSFKTNAFIVSSLVTFALPAKAAFTTGFDGASPYANFAPQGGWVISNTDDQLSFGVPAGGVYGDTVALGGFFSTPATVSTKLSRPISEPALGGAGKGYFKVDFSLINGNAADSSNFFNQDDTFGFSLSDSGGTLLSIDFAPTSDEGFRKINLATLGGGAPNLTNQGVVPSDFASPAFYTLYLNFAAEGADLKYTGSISGVILPNFSGIIAGKASTTFTEIGINYLVTDADTNNAGSNFILVDNISIPEPTVTLTGLMSLGLLSLRRRR